MENKKELAEFLELQLSHYNITKGFISDCLYLFENKKEVEGLKDNLNIDVNLEVGKLRLRQFVGDGNIEGHKFNICLGMDGTYVMEFTEAKDKNGKWVNVVLDTESIVEKSYKLLLKKGYIKK